VIEYRDIHKSFDIPVLRGVDLTVATGETVAIVGPSGCGKSVLLKTTIGLIEPDSGDVLIDGESVYRAAAADLRRILGKVGYVFQNAALFDSCDVYDNVAMGVPPEEARSLRGPELRARVLRALEEVNLASGQVMAKVPAELSGGMRKRVGIARAIAGQPKYLLYDEPTSGLDPVNSDIIDDLVKSLADELGVTSIMVTHDVKGAFRTADRIALLTHGKIVQIGTPKEFMASTVPEVREFLERDFGNVTFAA